MAGLDYWFVLLSVLIILDGITVILLALLIVRRALYVIGFGYAGKHKNKTMAWLSLICLIAGAILLLAFGLSGGPNGVHTAAALNGYIEVLFSIGLLFASVILTCLVRLPRPKRDEKLNQKIVQHAYVAWPWRHKWIFLPTALIVIFLGIFTYHLLRNHQSTAQPTTPHPVIRCKASNIFCCEAASPTYCYREP